LPDAPLSPRNFQSGPVKYQPQNSVCLLFLEDPLSYSPSGPLFYGMFLLTFCYRPLEALYPSPIFLQIVTLPLPCIIFPPIRWDQILRFPPKPHCLEALLFKFSHSPSFRRGTPSPQPVLSVCIFRLSLTIPVFPPSQSTLLPSFHQRSRTCPPSRLYNLQIPPTSAVYSQLPPPISWGLKFPQLR